MIRSGKNLSFFEINRRSVLNSPVFRFSCFPVKSSKERAPQANILILSDAKASDSAALNRLALPHLASLSVALKGLEASPA